MPYPSRRFAFAILPFLLTGCEELISGSSDRFREDFHFTEAMTSKGQFSLESRNGSVEIIGWDRPEVEISGTKYARSESELQAIKIDIVKLQSSVRVRTIAPSGARNWGAKYTVHVPRNTRIDRIETSNGSINLDTAEGGSQLRTSNGSVRIGDCRDQVGIVTSNGSVEVDNLDGELNAETSNGKIRILRGRGELKAKTSNGSVTAVLTDPEPGRPVRIDTSNGKVDLTLERLRGNDVYISSSNSSVDLTLPNEASGTIKANTSSHSKVRSDFDLMVRSGSLGKDSVEGTLNGGGSPQIVLNTSNGNIELHKLR